MNIGQLANQLMPQPIDMGPAKEWMKTTEQMLTKYYAGQIIQEDRELHHVDELDWWLTDVGKESRELAKSA